MLLNFEKHPNIEDYKSYINTFSGLAKFYTKNNPELRNQLDSFVRQYHLYDPQFYIPNNINFADVMCPQKRIAEKDSAGKFTGRNINSYISDKRIQEVIKALVLSLMLPVKYLEKSNLINTGNLPTIYFTKIKEYIHNKFISKLLEERIYNELSNKAKKFIADDDAYDNFIIDIMNKSKECVDKYWSDGKKIQKLFAHLHCEKGGYCYGTKNYGRFKCAKNNNNEQFNNIVFEEWHKDQDPSKWKMRKTIWMTKERWTSKNFRNWCLRLGINRDALKECCRFYENKQQDDCLVATTNVIIENTDFIGMYKYNKELYNNNIQYYNNKNFIISNHTDEYRSEQFIKTIETVDAA
jgi:hypothetical protein